MDNFDWLVYTYKHRRMFAYVADKLIVNQKDKEEILRRAEVHDMDKMLMYLFMDQIESQMEHVRTQPHHLESGMCNSYYDRLEMVIDYECAPYTKPDKPLNAYDFLNKLCEIGYVDAGTALPLFDIMADLKIDSSYSATIKDPAGMNYAAGIETPTEADIVNEIRNYVNHNRSTIPDILYKRCMDKYM